MFYCSTKLPHNKLKYLALYFLLLTSIFNSSCGNSDSWVSVNETVFVRNKTGNTIEVFYNDSVTSIVSHGASKTIEAGNSEAINLTFKKGRGSITVKMGELKKSYSVELENGAGEIIVKFEDF
jgi:hypothetical protein